MPQPRAGNKVARLGSLPARAQDRNVVALLPSQPLTAPAAPQPYPHLHPQGSNAEKESRGREVTKTAEQGPPTQTPHPHPPKTEPAHLPSATESRGGTGYQPPPAPGAAEISPVSPPGGLWSRLGLQSESRSRGCCSHRPPVAHMGGRWPGSETIKSCTSASVTKTSPGDRCGARGPTEGRARAAAGPRAGSSAGGTAPPGSTGGGSPSPKPSPPLLSGVPARQGARGGLGGASRSAGGRTRAPRIDARPLGQRSIASPEPGRQPRYQLLSEVEKGPIDRYQ